MGFISLKVRTEECIFDFKPNNREFAEKKKFVLALLLDRTLFKQVCV